MKLQDAVKKETLFIAGSTCALSAVTALLFYILHGFFPETVPFGFRVIASLILGCLVAILNFFWMAVTVQKVASMDNEDSARHSLLLSYRYRTLGQLAWVVLAIIIPALNAAAGIIPLFFPSAVIKARGIFSALKKDPK